MAQHLRRGGPRPEYFAQLQKKKVIIWTQGPWAIFSGNMLGYDPKTDRLAKLPPLVAPDPTKSFKPKPVEVYAELEATSTARTPKQLFPTRTAWSSTSGRSSD